MAINVKKLQRTRPPNGMPFKINKLGHVVLQVSNLERSLDCYTQILGFKVSDVYPNEMMPGGMILGASWREKLCCRRSVEHSIG